MVINYRALNKITVNNRFPLPLTKNLMAKLQCMKRLSKLDCFCGYHRHRNNPDSIKNTAFIGRDRLYGWLVQLFGVANAPSEFMRLMIDLLQKHIDDNYCIVFIDNILIHCKDDKEHSRHIKAVLDTIRKAGFRLQEAKCTFVRTKALYLRFEIDRENDNIQMTQQKVKAITD
jgi:hypothetical protein